MPEPTSPFLQESKRCKHNSTCVIIDAGAILFDHHLLLINILMAPAFTAMPVNTSQTDTGSEDAKLGYLFLVMRL